LEEILTGYLAGRKAPELLIEGFGSFHERVVFLNAEPSPQAAELVRGLAQRLKGLPWLDFGKNDGGTKLHATLMYAKTNRIFKEAFALLSAHRPRFEALLDNVSILKKENGAWSIYREYKLEA
ncbi:MAG TPA: 2'-5' RNA ligase family protein, partial [Candidatus Paceibacterota bacterium]|nr:2'-5' RNA ligase family protein [Candidatus Paceibacterota bacterium]